MDIAPYHNMLIEIACTGIGCGEEVPEDRLSYKIRRFALARRVRFIFAVCAAFIEQNCPAVKQLEKIAIQESNTGSHAY